MFVIMHTSLELSFSECVAVSVHGNVQDVFMCFCMRPCMWGKGYSHSHFHLYLISSPRKVCGGSQADASSIIGEAERGGLKDLHTFSS